MFKKFTRMGLAAIAALGLAVTSVQADHHEHALPQDGVVVFKSTKGNKVAGRLALKQTKDGVKITGQVRNLTPGEHGFHIHEFGDLRAPDGSSAGGHFNPDGHEHGGPDSEKRHAGDLGNITANEEGVAKVDILAKGLKLHFIIGRSFVVHAGKDDLSSQPSGDAGPRVAVGVVGIAQPAMKKGKKDK